jgi:hypothetical protein
MAAVSKAALAVACPVCQGVAPGAAAPRRAAEQRPARCPAQAAPAFVPATSPLGPAGCCHLARARSQPSRPAADWRQLTAALAPY